MFRALLERKTYRHLWTRLGKFSSMAYAQENSFPKDQALEPDFSAKVFRS